MVDFEWWQFVELRQMQNTKKPFNAQLIWEHSTYGLYFVDSADQTVLLKTTDKGITVTVVDISDNTNSYKIQAGWLDGVDLWLLMCDNDGTADDFEVCYIEMDDSDDCNPVAVSAGADANSVYAWDIFKIGANVYVYNTELRAAVCWMVVWDVDTAPFVEKATDAPGGSFANGDNLSFSVIVGTDAYFWADFAPGTFVMMQKYVSAAPAITNLGNTAVNYSAPDRSQQSIAYDGDDLMYLVLKKDGDGKDYLFKYSIAGNNLTELELYDIVLMLDRNCANTANSPWLHEKGFHVTSSFVYQIHRGYTHLLKLQDIGLTGGEVIIAITDNYLVTDNSDLYEFTNSIDDFKQAKGTLKCWDVPVGGFSLATELSPDQLIEIYENDGGTYELCFRGKCGRPEYINANRVYKYKPNNLGWDDLDEKISYDAVAEGADEVVLALIGELVNPYIYGDAVSVPNIAINITYNFDDVKLRDALYVICILTNGYFWVEPNGYLYFRIYGNPPASGDAYTFAAKNMSAPSLNILQIQHNDFSNVRGGWDGANSKEFAPTSPLIEAHILQFGRLLWRGRKSFVGADAQAELDAVITALKIWEGMITNPFEISFYAKDKYYYPVGYHCTLTFSPIDALDFAAPEDFLIIESIIDFQRKGAVYATISNNITRSESK